MNEAIEYLPCKTIVTATKNNEWFGSDYNMNIYRGCSHGCIYCDSRSEGYRDDSFFKVKVKENALNIIERDLKGKRVKGVVGTGSMSDPYNPLEKKLELTAGALRLLARYGFGVAIATKSSLISRDLTILQEINKTASVIVKLTITTADDEVARIIEPYIAPSSERFAALEELSARGIYCGILLMPVLPFITDTVENIEAIVEKAAASKANFIYPAFGMTLRDRQRAYYFDQLDQHFPGLSEKYKFTYGNQYSCGSKEAKQLMQHLVFACEKYGIQYKMKEIIGSYQKNRMTEQLQLF